MFLLQIHEVLEQSSQVLNSTQSLNTQYDSDNETSVVDEVPVTSRGRRGRGTPRVTARARGKRQSKLNFQIKFHP